MFVGKGTSFMMYCVYAMMVILLPIFNYCKAQDACTNNPCKNGGTCFLASDSSASNAFMCICPHNFKGFLCDTSTELSPPFPANTPCSSGPCMNGATCVNPANPLSMTAICQCAPGYIGYTCDRLDTGKGDCDPNPCGDNGRCDPSPFEFKGYTCQCNHGYTGNNCELSLSGEYNGCGSSPCLNGALCMNQYETQDYYCECTSGYSGRHCEVEGPCVKRPCLNGGSCREEAFASLGYICICTSEYYGINCTEAYQSNPCNPSPCQNEGRCFQLMQTEFNQNLTPYFCSCLGYVGTNCQNIDPCYSNPCMNGGTCTLIAPGGNEDMVQGFWCECPSTFTGTTCSEPDPCLSNPCLNGATCTTVRDVVDPLFEDQNAVYWCNCEIGWTGLNCSQELPRYDACSSNPCFNGASCVAISTIYTCECKDGFVGSRCELIDPCSSNPCFNGGQCFISSQKDSFICQCLPSFTGQYCEMNEPSCLSDPCLNGGTCTFDTNVQVCECAQGFLGLRCESTDPCYPPPCQNFGVCWRNVDATDFICRCASGYGGKLCEVILEPTTAAQIYDCESNPCEGESTCVLEGPDSLGNFYPMCLCPLGFTGVTCGIKLPPTAVCQPNPCMNGGGCTPSPHSPVGYICTCHQGYTGIICQYLTLDGESPTTTTSAIPSITTVQSSESKSCQSNPCLNNGTCIDVVNIYFCICPTFFVGTTCATDVRDCSFGDQSFKDGESRKEGCGECVCDNSEWDCTSNVCECYADGNVYNNNETWYEDCNTCACQNGITLCTNIDCSRVCLHDDQLYDVGAQRDDRCSTCLCQFGRWYCAPLDDCVDNTCMYGITPYEEGSIRPQHCNLCTCFQNDWQCTTSNCDIYPAISQATIELDKGIPQGKENEFIDTFRNGMVQTFTLGNSQIQNIEMSPYNGTGMNLEFTIVKNSSEEISVDVIKDAIENKVENGDLEVTFEGQTYIVISSKFTVIEIEHPTEELSNTGRDNMSMIIGAVGGSIGVIVIIVCIVVFLYLYSKRKEGKQGNRNGPLHLQQLALETPPESPVSRPERSRTIPAHFRFKI
ncbi:fibropellin-1-like [Lytechinus variegatus]|uniref:fibropellin-1-like n=1 Tax=Lytechinus variegatus TaxID=7654 RepID=UPI001BB27EAA|nr:fibropellin-1-like [Lytechinus variegatus]